jgi:hypothetical protein
MNCARFVDALSRCLRAIIAFRTGPRVRCRIKLLAEGLKITSIRCRRALSLLGCNTTTKRKRKDAQTT